MSFITQWAQGNANSGTGLTPFSAGLTLSSFSSLATGSGVVGSSPITNGTNLDQYSKVAGILVPAAALISGGFLSLYLLPKNLINNTIYGDATSSGASPPSISYNVGNFQIANGLVGTTDTVCFDFGVFTIPPEDFLFALWNNLGVAISSMTGLDTITFNINLNG